MKLITLTGLAILLPLCSALADKPAIPAGPTGIEKHRKGAEKLAMEQDDLSADVQDLIDEQSDPKVIKLLKELEQIMADATDRLENTQTDGATIAIETEIIEKIFEAAKKKQQQQQGQGQGQGMQDMLEMMKRMMEGGRDAGQGQQPGNQPGQKPGQGQGEGQGGGGDGNGEAGGKTGDPDNTAENDQRRVPRNSGTAGSSLPREFHKAMDAYNKGAADKARK